MTNVSILDIQERLISLGFDPGPADAHDGPKTRKAIAAFQAEKGLFDTGHPASKLTLAEMFPEKQAPELDS